MASLKEMPMECLLAPVASYKREQYFDQIKVEKKNQTLQSRIELLTPVGRRVGMRVGLRVGYQCNEKDERSEKVK